MRDNHDHYRGFRIIWILTGAGLLHKRLGRKPGERDPATSSIPFMGHIGFGLDIFALAGVMYRLEQILRELRRLNPGTEGATEGSSDSR